MVSQHSSNRQHGNKRRDPIEFPPRNGLFPQSLRQSAGSLARLVWLRRTGCTLPHNPLISPALRKNSHFRSGNLPVPEFHLWMDPIEDLFRGSTASRVLDIHLQGRDALSGISRWIPFMVQKQYTDII
ncbi:MAG: hypothetical protein DRH37_01635 [Deltaproteobacteria bacterium]|nr:MAG: hypothetical protein DRH37_01635 [Deltaproteobacteria bacterium]